MAAGYIQPGQTFRLQNTARVASGTLNGYEIIMPPANPFNYVVTKISGNYGQPGLVVDITIPFSDKGHGRYFERGAFRHGAGASDASGPIVYQEEFLFQFAELKPFTLKAVRYGAALGQQDVFYSGLLEADGVRFFKLPQGKPLSEKTTLGFLPFLESPQLWIDDRNRFWCAGLYRDLLNNISQVRIYRSPDGALSWDQIDTTFPKPILLWMGAGHGVEILAIGLESDNFTRRFVRSLDGGATWSAPAVTNFSFTSPDPTRAEFSLVSNRQSVSPDNGRSWIFPDFVLPVWVTPSGATGSAAGFTNNVGEVRRLANRGILAFLRNNTSPNIGLWSTISFDKGASWRVASLLPAAAYAVVADQSPPQYNLSSYQARDGRICLTDARTFIAASKDWARTWSDVT